MNLLVLVLLQFVGVVKALATYVTIVLSNVCTFAYVPLKKKLDQSYSVAKASKYS